MVSSDQQTSESNMDKKPYVAPVVVVYGSISQITQAKAGTMGDGAQVPTTRA